MPSAVSCLIQRNSSYVSRTSLVARYPPTTFHVFALRSPSAVRSLSVEVPYLASLRQHECKVHSETGLWYMYVEPSIRRNLTTDRRAALLNSAKVTLPSFVTRLYYMRTGDQSSPSPSHHPNDSVQTVYLSYHSWVGLCHSYHITSTAFFNTQICFIAIHTTLAGFVKCAA